MRTHLVAVLQDALNNGAFLDCFASSPRLNECLACQASVLPGPSLPNLSVQVPCSLRLVGGPGHGQPCEALEAAKNAFAQFLCYISG